jgi:hypothetical protein
MKELITSLIIALLLAIVIVQKSCTPIVEKSKKDTIVVTKVVRVIIHDTIYADPKIVTRIIPGKILPPQYLPDTNYTTLKKQYQKLVTDYLSKSIYEDKLNLDTLGNIIIKDTVQFNKLGKRSYEINLRTFKRIDSVFVTTPSPIKRQLYAGVGVIAFPAITSLGIRGSILYKDKKDNMFSPSVILTTNGNIIYGIDTYFKIKLK